MFATWLLLYYVNQFLLRYIWKFKNSVVLKCFITASIYIILKCLTFSRTHQINWNLKLVAHIIFMTVEEAFLYNDF